MLIVHEHKDRNAIEFEEFSSGETLEIEVPEAVFNAAVTKSILITTEFDTLRYGKCRKAINDLELSYMFGGYE